MAVLRGGSIAVCGALLALIAIMACTQATATPVPDFLKAAQEKAPFEIALPTFLPHGMELANADVIVPPPGMGMEGDSRETNTQVLLRFTNADGTATIVLYESMAGTSLGTANVSRVDVGGVEGQSVEDQEQRFLTIAWPGEEIGYLLTGYLTGKLTRDEIMRIAESLEG